MRQENIHKHGKTQPTDPEIYKLRNRQTRASKQLLKHIWESKGKYKHKEYIENLNKNMMETTKYQANFRNTKMQKTVSQLGLSWGPPGHQWADGISAKLQ